jgi:hypothetical protein
MADELVRITSKACPGCGGYGTYEVTKEQYVRLCAGRESVSQILAEFGPGVWERFITGYCTHCWDRMFKSREDF